jgi:hypothetical protein
MPEISYGATHEQVRRVVASVGLCFSRGAYSAGSTRFPDPVKVLFYTRAVYTLPVVVGLWTFPTRGDCSLGPEEARPGRQCAAVDGVAEGCFDWSSPGFGGLIFFN